MGSFVGSRAGLDFSFKRKYFNTVRGQTTIPGFSSPMSSKPLDIYTVGNIYDGKMTFPVV
jgi:hypothetical protein